MENFYCLQFFAVLMGSAVFMVIRGMTGLEQWFSKQDHMESLLKCGVLS